MTDQSEWLEKAMELAAKCELAYSDWYNCDRPCDCDGDDSELQMLFDAMESTREALRAHLSLRAVPAGDGVEPVLKNFAPSREWLAEKLEQQGDIPDPAPLRPCDVYPGCNGHNCLGCGEVATPPADQGVLQLAKDVIENAPWTEKRDEALAAINAALEKQK